MTLLNNRPDLSGDQSGDSAAGNALTMDLSPATDDLQSVRSGPEMDDARTAPIALVGQEREAEEPVRRRLLHRDNVLRSGFVRQFASFVAVAGFAAGSMLHAPLVAVVLCLVAVVLPSVTGRELGRLVRGLGPVGMGTTTRALLALCLLQLTPDQFGGGALAAVLCAAILTEPMLAKVDGAAVPYASNLPGVAVRNRPLLVAPRVYVVNTVLVLGAVIAVAAGARPWALLAAGLLALLVTVGALVDATLRVRARRTADAEVLAQAVADYAPRFALHWDAPPGTAYQVTMWLPYLERIGERFVVVVRNAKSFAEVASATTAPVIVRQDPRSLDAVVPPSLRAVFYVNNAARNTHLIRFTGLTHVQLNHGESDKAPSYSPVFRLYDKDFVAGQAAIDRFAANGVPMPDQLFTIVGRPQIEDVVVGTSTSAVPTALYAPTWGGANADSDYCSLPIGYRIVESLLERGYTVVFRPHPYTDRRPEHRRESARIVELLAADAARSGRLHRFGRAATAEMSLVDCFNAADVLVSDVSSVVPDFLYSEKPFAVASMQGSVSEFAREFPIARASYVLDGHGRNIDQVLDSMTGADPVAPARAEAKRYFLGDLPGDGYADVFLREARKVVVGA